MSSGRRGQEQEEQPIRAVITGNRLVNEHTEYRVELRAGPVKLSSVSRRFREFSELHAQLSNYRHAFPIPNIPPKKFFGRTNPEFVLKRQKELQVFLDELVQLIVKNPPAEMAWRLLCLFLALDPKQYLPESILNLADQTAGTGSTAGTAGTSVANAGGTGTSTANSGAEMGSGSYNASSAPGMLPETEEDGHHDLNQLQVEEMRRMDKIVDDFARQIINVSRSSEERLQVPSAALLSRINVAKLQQDLEKHILAQPFVSPAAKKKEQQQEQSEQQERDNSEENEATDDAADKTAESTTNTPQYQPIVGANEIIVSLDS